MLQAGIDAAALISSVDTALPTDINAGSDRSSSFHAAPRPQKQVASCFLSCSGRARRDQAAHSTS